MRNLLFVVVLLAAVSAFGQQTGTFVTGSDQCHTDYLTQANLFALYLCPIQNETLGLYSFSYIGDVEIGGGVVFGWRACEKEIYSPYKWERTDEVHEASCQCDNHWNVSNTAGINPSCTAGLGSIKHYVGQICTF